MRSAVLIGAFGGLWLAVATHAPQRQETPPPKQETPAPKAEAPKLSVIVPFFGNEKCPIDGNATERDRFAEVDGQRVYVCSAPCFETAKLEGTKALEKAYPEVQPATTKTCGLCGAAIEIDPEKPKADAHAIVFQGRTIRICSSACEKDFRLMPGVWLARIRWPEVKDAGNVLCPIDDQKVDGVTVAIFKGTLVRLSSPACVAKFGKDPEGALAKVKAGG